MHSIIILYNKVSFSKDEEEWVQKIDSKIIFEGDPSINFYFSSTIKYDDNYIYDYIENNVDREALTSNFSRRTIRTWLHSTIILYTI